jgi:hypothetical protein
MNHDALKDELFRIARAGAQQALARWAALTPAQRLERMREELAQIRRDSTAQADQDDRFRR